VEVAAPAVEFALQAQGNPDGRKRQDQAAAEGHGKSQDERPAQAVGGRRQPLFGSIQTLLVRGRDAVRNLQHGGAARNQFVVEEGIAPAVALLRRPLQGAVEDAPVSLDLRPQGGKRLPLPRFQQGRIGIQCGTRLTLERSQARTLCLRGGGVRREQEIPHVGAREIDPAANLIQGAQALQEGAPSLPFSGADPVEDEQRARGRTDDRDQQSPETERQHQPRRLRPLPSRIPQRTVGVKQQFPDRTLF